MIELIGSDQNVKLSDKQVDELTLLLKREETLLLEDQIERALEKQFLQEEQKDNSKTSSKVTLKYTLKDEHNFLLNALNAFVFLNYLNLLQDTKEIPSTSQKSQKQPPSAEVPPQKSSISVKSSSKEGTPPKQSL